MSNNIEALIGCEISDFFAGFGQPGEPETPEQMQLQLLRRVLPILSDFEYQMERKDKRIAELESHQPDAWKPERCPITGRPFFLWLDHPDLGCVPTYGGAYDSYTLAEKDDNGEYFVHRYDHDEGAWVEDEAVYVEGGE